MPYDIVAPERGKRERNEKVGIYSIQKERDNKKEDSAKQQRSD